MLRSFNCKVLSHAHRIETTYNIKIMKGLIISSKLREIGSLENAMNVVSL
jgi:hypothetical protein